jgi:hypothetical protein
VSFIRRFALLLCGVLFIASTFSSFTKSDEPTLEEKVG